MDVLVALILSCSLHFDDHLVEALSRKLSINNQYFVGDLSDLNTYDSAKSVADARRIVDARLSTMLLTSASQRTRKSGATESLPAAAPSTIG
jgi:hypothetical protein